MFVRNTINILRPLVLIICFRFWYLVLILTSAVLIFAYDLMSETVCNCPTNNLIVQHLVGVLGDKLQQCNICFLPFLGKYILNCCENHVSFFRDRLLLSLLCFLYYPNSALKTFIRATAGLVLFAFLKKIPPYCGGHVHGFTWLNLCIMCASIAR